MPSDKLIKVTNNLRDEIARREKICAAATPGPWIAQADYDNAIWSTMMSSRDGEKYVDDAVATVPHLPTRVAIAHARTGYPETLAALADAVAALEWYVNRGSVEPRTISGRRAKDALAQIAGRLENKG